MRRARGRLPAAAFGVGAGDVEIAQGGEVDRMGGSDVAQHRLGHQLRHAVRVDRRLRVALGHGHLLGRAVGRGGRGEDEMAHAAHHGALDHRAAGNGVVAVIFERVTDRFRHHHRTGEMHHRAHVMLAHRGADRAVILDICLDQRGAGIDRPVEAGDEVVDDDHPVSCVEQRENRVASDIARPARNQHRPVKHHDLPYNRGRVRACIQPPQHGGRMQALGATRLWCLCRAQQRARKSSIAS